MKPFRRTALYGLAVVLWLVCMAAIELWIRGYNGHADCLRYQSESWPLTEADVSPDNAAASRVNQVRRRRPQSLLTKHLMIGADHGYLFIAQGKDLWPENMPGFSYVDLPRELQPSASYGRLWSINAGPIHMHGWAVPLWAIIIVSGVLPLWITVNSFNKRIRRLIQGDRSHRALPNDALTQVPSDSSPIKRKRRRARNTLAAVSWLICMTTIELRVRSGMGHADNLRFERRSWPVTDADFPPENASWITLAQRRSLSPELHMSSGFWIGVTSGDLFLAQGTVFWPRNESGIRRMDLPMIYRPLGQRFWIINFYTTHIRGGALPLWIIIIVTGIMPVWIAFSYYKGKIRQMVRRHRITLQGLCPACGYDIRATPSRCPECGADCKSRSVAGESPAVRI